MNYFGLAAGRGRLGETAIETGIVIAFEMWMLNEEIASIDATEPPTEMIKLASRLFGDEIDQQAGTVSAIQDQLHLKLQAPQQTACMLGLPA